MAMHSSGYDFLKQFAQGAEEADTAEYTNTPPYIGNKTEEKRVAYCKYVTGSHISYYQLLQVQIAWILKKKTTN